MNTEYVRRSNLLFYVACSKLSGRPVEHHTLYIMDRNEGEKNILFAYIKLFKWTNALSITIIFGITFKGSEFEH